MSKRTHLDNNPGKRLGRLAFSAACVATLALASTANAATGDNSVRGVSSVGHASATIVNPTSLRTTELQNAGTDFASVSGLAVAPAAIVRRDCADDRVQQRCNLVILDMP